MKRLEKKHPLAIRWLHWINFPLLALMIWSGLLIYWANSVYDFRIGSWKIFHFFPDSFFDKLNLTHRLAEGMGYHFFFMWLFAANGALYVLYTAISGEWRYLVPNRESFKEAFQVTLYDLHLSKKHPPRRKFNGAQQFAYTGVILMGAGSLLTGLAIYKPATFSFVTRLCGGYEWARWEHFWLTIGYVLFFIVHIAQVARAGWNNFCSMVTGYEIVPADEPPIETTEPHAKSVAPKTPTTEGATVS